MSAMMQPHPVDDAAPATLPRRMADDSVIGKVHLLLGAFTEDSPCLGLGELSRRSGVSKATAYRLALQLVELGYLAKTANGYQLGWYIFEMGRSVPGPIRLASAARPVMVDLRTSVKAALVHLAIAQGSEVVDLERIAGRHESYLLSDVGPKAPALSTATGRVLLAYGAAVTDMVDLRARGIDPERLGREFEAIRARRWAVESGSRAPGTKTIAVPVFGHGSSEIVAALSITVPQGRRDDQQILHALWLSAREIEYASRERRSASGAELRLPQRA